MPSTANAKTASAKNTEDATSRSILEQEDATSRSILEQVIKATNEARGTTEYNPAMLDSLPPSPSPIAIEELDIDAFLDVQIERLENRLHAQLDRFLHHPTIASKLGKWKAIQDLVLDPVRDEERCQVSLIPARKRELFEDFKKSGWTVNETDAYRLLVRQRYGVYGGNPFLVCLTDVEIGPGADDMKLAGALAELGAQGHMPVLPPASPAFFKIKHWSDLPPSRRELASIWKSKDNDEFRRFRERDDSRFLPISMLRVANRVPFGRGVEAEGLESYVEGLAGPDDLTMVTSNFAVTRLIVQSLCKHGWPSAIIGNYGGQIGGLYSFDFEVGGEDGTTCPTEFPIDDLLEMFFEDECGFLAPVHCQGTNQAALFAAPTIQKTLRGDPESQADASAGGKLPNVLVQSMFAHLLKVMLRAMIGSGMKRGQIETFLQNWADKYVSTDENASEAAKASKPFSRIRVRVETVKGRSGVLQARVELTPRFRVAAVTTKLLITSDDDTDKPGNQGAA